MLKKSIENPLFLKTSLLYYCNSPGSPYRGKIKANTLPHLSVYLILSNEVNFEPKNSIKTNKI